MKTDEQLRDEVMEELDFDSAITSTDIGVEVNNRVVTLSGYPPSYAEKIAAEKAAQRVSGVKAVVIDMHVRLPHVDTRSDEELANTVRGILSWTVGLPEAAVMVQVEKGWVTLNGEVSSMRLSQLAARSIGHVRGVVGVSNLLKVTNSEATADLAEQIGRALKRHADRAAKHIQIKVQDGAVTLSGTVSSYAERALIRGAAWSAPGVCAVIDNVEIA